MRKHLVLSLLILALVPAYGFVPDQSIPTVKAQVSSTPSAQATPTPASDFAQWLETGGQTPVSNCGPNFCTQAQRTKCAASCRHHPFVGLECCEATCTSFCNCGSVPTGC